MPRFVAIKGTGLARQIRHRRNYCWRDRPHRKARNRLLSTWMNSAGGVLTVFSSGSGGVDKPARSFSVSWPTSGATHSLQIIARGP
jgi:hypothetical protein